MLYYSMSFVSLDEDVDVAGNLSHCCCNVFDDLVVVNEDDDSFYLENVDWYSNKFSKVKSQSAF